MRRLILAGLFIAAPAFAQTPLPTVDFTSPYLGATGKQLRDNSDQAPDDPHCDHCAGVTLGQEVAICLDNDAKADPSKKAAEWALANRVLSGKAVSLDAHERTLIEDCVNSNMLPLVAGQVDHLLEPEKYPDK